ncbi:MAG: tetratricopeptide repeat protein [Candidatus Binataceae bacterium]
MSTREKKSVPHRVHSQPWLAAACLALALGAHPRACAADMDRWTLAELQEQTFGAEDIPAPTPEASPQPDGEQGAPSESTDGTSPPAAVDEGVMPPLAAPAPGTPRALAEPTPRPTPSEESNPLNVGSISPTVSVSTESLGPLIEQTNSPARATSLKLTEQARLAMARGDDAEVIALLTRAVSIDPTDSYAYFFLGRAYMERQRFEEAVGFFKRAENGFAAGNQPWLAETLAFEGLAYEQLGRATAAEASYQKSLDAAPGHLMARVGYTRITAQIHSEESNGADLAAPPMGPVIGPAPAAAPPSQPPGGSGPPMD